MRHGVTTDISKSDKLFFANPHGFSGKINVEMFDDQKAGLMIKRLRETPPFWVRSDSFSSLLPGAWGMFKQLNILNHSMKYITYSDMGVSGNGRYAPYCHMANSETHRFHPRIVEILSPWKSGDWYIIYVPNIAIKSGEFTIKTTVSCGFVIIWLILILYIFKKKKKLHLKIFETWKSKAETCLWNMSEAHQSPLWGRLWHLLAATNAGSSAPERWPIASRRF